MTVRVAVVGGGISGLAAAHRLRTLLGPDARITLLEGSALLGGVLRTVELAGLAYDVGAEAFLFPRPELPALLAVLGISDAVVHPTAAAASVRAAGRTHPLPAGTLFGVPTAAARLDGLLSPDGVAAVLAEPARALHWEQGSDVALGGLLRERFGAELVDRLVEPLLGGVYAGRVDSLGLRATLPALAAALDAGAHDLTEAATAAARPAGPAPAAGAPRVPLFGALRGGYRVLLDALVAAAAAEVRPATSVRSVRRRELGWRLDLDGAAGPGQLDADAVLLAVPATATARLLADAAPGAAAAAGGIELASSVVVALAYRPSDAAGLPATSGVLVAAGEPLAAKAMTHSSNKWAHLGADGLVRLRVSLGYGDPAVLDRDDDELLGQVRSDLAALHGITAAPVAVHVQRWAGGLPMYGPGHLDRVQAVRDGLPAGLAVAGAALRGVGVPACVGAARSAAERIAATLAVPARA